MNSIIARLEAYLDTLDVIGFDDFVKVSSVIDDLKKLQTTHQLMPIEPTPEIEGIFDDYLLSKCNVKMIYKEALARVAALAAAKEQA